MMKDIETNPGALKRYYSQLGMQLVASKSYLVISKDESTDVSEVVPFSIHRT